MSLRPIFALILPMLLAVMLNACGPADSGDSQVLTPLPTLPLSQATPTGPPAATIQTNYPAPESQLPPTPDSNYPAPSAFPPTVDPYPGGLVWIIRPVGIQCEEGTSPGYGDLREATSTLTAAGVRVARAEMTELIVTSVCGSPTSAHFRMQIGTGDLSTALSLGWTQES